MAAVLLLYALQFGRLKHTSLATGQRLLQSLLEIPEKMNEVLKQSEIIKNIAKQYQQYHNILFIGRGVNYPVALDDGKISAVYGPVRSIPTTFVIDKDAKIRKVYIGFRPKEVFEKDIQELLQ